MEVKINREIRNYTESMFFGLSMRQFVFFHFGGRCRRRAVFSLKALCRDGNRVVDVYSRRRALCGAGFITYHGMTAEQFIWAWIRSEFLEPKEIRFESSNFYYEALKSKIENHREVKHD